MIPLSVPNIGGNEWKYVKECLDTGWVSSVGRFVDLFEERLAAYTGARFAVATVNGTAALHVSLMVAGLERGFEVIVPTLTFIAPVNAVHYCGAVPVFMDCDEFYNLDVAAVRSFLETECRRDGVTTVNRRTGRRVWGVVPVHVFGSSVDLDPLVEVCREFGLIIVEDASESLGSTYKGKHTGTVGTLGCFSFNGNKIVTTGGGGMIVTNDEALAARCRHLTTQAKSDPLYYVHDEVGYNYRLTNVQAAIGLAQLEQLPEFISKKKQNFERYREGVRSIPGLTLGDVPSYCDSNYWFYSLRIDSAVYRRERDETMKHLQSQGISTRPVWHLNHLQSPYLDCPAFRISRATKLLETSLSLPCSSNLSADEVATVVEALR